MKTLPLLMIFTALALTPAFGDTGDCAAGSEGLECRAEAGDVQAQMLLGLSEFVANMESGELAEAIEWLRKAEASGEEKASVALETMRAWLDKRKDDAAWAGQWLEKLKERATGD